MENKNIDISKITFVSTSGDEEAEKQDLIEKLTIINRFFPFNEVKGYYDVAQGECLEFDTGLVILGMLEDEPYNARFILKHKTLEINFHPFGSMGGLDTKAFTLSIAQAFDFSKSPEASKVLRLMDEDYTYPEALRIVLVLTDVWREDLENELSRYI